MAGLHMCTFLSEQAATTVIKGGDTIDAVQSQLPIIDTKQGN